MTTHLRIFTPSIKTGKSKYQDQEITVEIETGLFKGHLGKKAIALIQEWRELHKSELMADWEYARQKKALLWIEPLE